MDDLDGEHTGVLEYILVNKAPPFAKLSICGVLTTSGPHIKACSLESWSR